ncbi:MAG TPA: EAL domain-containing protein [Egibacteraceae bacterium]|nr:EAL domain-containing protein [Egibacteraceae bacterium]
MSITAVLLGAAVLALYSFLPEAQSLLFLITGSGSVAAILAGLRRHRPRSKRPWLLIAAGIASWVVADILWEVYDRIGADVPFPSLADVLYLAGYPLLGLGLLWIARARGARIDSLLDTLVIAAGAGAVIGLGVVFPIAALAGEDVIARGIAVGYAVGALVLLAFGVRLLLGGGGRLAATWLLAAALFVQLLADSAYARAILTDGYEGGAMDLGWMAAYILVAAAALSPSMAELVERRPAPRNPLTISRFLLLMSAILAVPVSGVWLDIEPHGMADAATGVIFLLAAARLSVVVAAMARSATRDELTGLANRALLSGRLESALNTTKDARVALFVCDLDHFKIVNDGLGHDAGDRLLVELARRMQGCVRPGDTVARMGGDEFVVLLEDASDSTIAAIAQRIVAAVSKPVRVGADSEIVPSVSVGIAVGAVGTSAETMLSEADAAMYRAKERGRGRVERFDDDLRGQVRDRLLLQGELRAALARRELTCLHQPEIDLITGKLFGFESLVRWEHPERGLIMPDNFIPAAEATGVVGLLFEYVLEHTLKAQSEWAAQLGFSPAVAVNLSSRQLDDLSLPDTVAAALAAAGTPADALWFEVTESASADPSCLPILTALRRLGVHLVVDDFGTGWSSLSRLSLFSWDGLKIDRSFIARLGIDEHAEHVVRAMIAMAHALGMRTVAEGVETPAQICLLQELGCDIVQGFAFAEALPSQRAIDDVTPDGMWVGRSVITPAAPA